MTFFVDTNIPLGYTIIHDKFHDLQKISLKIMRTYSGLI